MRHILILSVFALLLVRPAAAAFELPKGQDCAQIPFRLIDNRAVYDVMVGDKGPFHFVFDTGANTVVDAALARELGVALDEIGQTGGAGAQTQTTWRTRLPGVSFGGVEGKNVDALALDLSSIKHAIGFTRLDGLMGREVLAAFLVRYDYDQSLLHVCDFGRAPPAMRSGQAVSFRWTAYEMPVLSGRVDGVEGDFIVDTGDRSSLTLFGPFAAKHKLRDAYRPVVSTITGQGVGGPIPADVAKAKAFAFAGETLTGVTTRMPTLTTGGFATETLAGSIGTGIMRRFNTTYDYRTRTMYLSPSAFFDRPDRYDRSGMWLTGEDAAGFRVVSVAAHGPAAKAGIVAGDRVTHIGGTAAGSLSLIAIRDQLMDLPVGATMRLTVRGQGGEPRSVMLTLADQI